MKTLLLVMLLLTACSGDEKKDTQTQSDSSLIDMMVIDMSITASDLEVHSTMDLEVQSDLMIDMETPVVDMETPMVDMSVLDMSSSDMASASDMSVVDMTNTTDM
jgi:hypothetical protein